MIFLKKYHDSKNLQIYTLAAAAIGGQTFAAIVFGG
jgi:hypothetical protein